MRVAVPGRLPACLSRRALPLRAPRLRCAPAAASAPSGTDEAEEALLDTAGEVAAWALAPAPPPLLCAADARALLSARAAGAAIASVSLDLGRSADVSASLSEQGVRLAHPSALALLLLWPAVASAAEDSNGTQQLLAPGPEAREAPQEQLSASGPASALPAAASLARISTFSESTSRPVALYPSPSGRGPPSALVAGFSMHRFGKGAFASQRRNRTLPAWF